MTAAQTALDVAQTALVATVVASAIAVVGTVVGSFAGPWIRDRFDRKRIAEGERRGEIRRLLVALEQAIAGISLTNAKGDRTYDHGINLIRYLAELELWLETDELDIGRIFREAAGNGADRAIQLNAAVTATGMWYRGEIGASAALEQYHFRVREQTKAKAQTGRGSNGGQSNTSET